MQLPGRETRLNEARFTSLSDVVGPVVEAMRPYLEVPCALFGHSLGAALAYEVAVALSAVSPPAPVHLFVSGRGGPSRGAETTQTFSARTSLFFGRPGRERRTGRCSRERLRARR